MNLINKKIKAFTLLELIVVLILSGVVTLMAYYMLNVTRSYYHKFNEKEQSISTLSKLAMIIDQDFHKANTITGGGSIVSCNFETHEVTYQFLSAYAVRSQSIVQDTFYLTINDMILKRIDERHTTINGMSENDLVQELQLIVGLEDSVFLHFKKVYSASTLFQTQLEKNN